MRSTANGAHDHKNVVRTPDFKDRLAAASAAKKAQTERARAIAEDPARLRRMEARSEIIAARNIRIAERERVRREAIAREAAERAAAEATEAEAQATCKAEEEAREARRVEQARRDATAAAEREEALSCDPQSGSEEEEAQGSLRHQPTAAKIGYFGYNALRLCKRRPVRFVPSKLPSSLSLQILSLYERVSTYGRLSSYAARAARRFTARR